jgi:hypothetical protein
VLHRYFIRPTTVDRVRASWIGEAIERYVVWLTDKKYAARNVSFRVPVLVRFGEFAQRSGATRVEELPDYIEPFIDDWLSRRKQGYSEGQRLVAAREVRNPIRQLLQVTLPEYGGTLSGCRIRSRKPRQVFSIFFGVIEVSVRQPSFNTDIICSDSKII